MKTGILLLLLGLSMPLHYAGAATRAATENPQGPNGLWITNAEVTGSETSLIVNAGISRSRLTRVLAPVRLQINLVNADGTIAASKVKIVSAADLVRLNSRDRHVKVAFEDLQDVESYTVSLRWL